MMEDIKESIRSESKGHISEAIDQSHKSSSGGIKEEIIEDFAFSYSKGV